MTKDEFTQYLFCRNENTEWYFHEEHEDPKLTGMDIVIFSTHIFQDIEKISKSFTEKQLCMGLRYLIDSSCSSTCFYFLDNAIPIADRLAALSSMSYVFGGLFAQHCKQTTPFSNLLDIESLTFVETCYLWWDIFPRHGVPASPSLTMIDSTILQTLEKILLIDNFACKESALHGLGHWVAAQDNEVESIIQRMHKFIPAELKAYALNASKGSIQ